MSRKGLIDAFNKLAEAAAVVAIELEAAEQPASEPVGAAEGVPPSAAAALTTPLAECPKHHKAFTPSKNPEWPAYCASTSDDPAWSNAKGYCRINSKNAGEWLALHGRAA